MVFLGALNLGLLHHFVSLQLHAFVEYESVELAEKAVSNPSAKLLLLSNISMA